VELLLARGANPNAAFDGQPAIFSALEHPETLKSLLGRRADPSARDARGMPALLAAGADPAATFTDEKGGTQTLVSRLKWVMADKFQRSEASHVLGGGNPGLTDAQLRGAQRCGRLIARFDAEWPYSALDSKLGEVPTVVDLLAEIKLHRAEIAALKKAAAEGEKREPKEAPQTVPPAHALPVGAESSAPTEISAPR
jgi:hypothetical protein